jgi:hypothetical protein
LIDFFSYPVARAGVAFLAAALAAAPIAQMYFNYRLLQVLERQARALEALNNDKKKV